MKVENSWRKPNGVPNLIGRKQVDWSLFLEGSRIPQGFITEFEEANHSPLQPGEVRPVTLRLQGRTFQAQLQRESGLNRSQIRFNDGAALRDLLRQTFKASYDYLAQQRSQHSPEDGKARYLVPDELAEFMEFYATGTPFVYDVKLVTSEPGLPSFDRAWDALLNLIGDGATFQTLAQGAENHFSVLSDGAIQIQTSRGTDRLSRDLFAPTWAALRQQHFLKAEEFPGTAKYRSTAISTLFAQLPYLDYTTFPAIALFWRGHTFTRDELHAVFGVPMQGGINFRGKADNPHLTVFTTSVGVEADDNPYHDRWMNGNLHYTGEGQRGDQQLSRGNLALNSCIAKPYPIYGFRKPLPNRYEYLGRFQTLEALQERQPDADDKDRNVWVFMMQPIQTAYPSPVEPKLLLREDDEVAVAPVKDLKLITTAFQTALKASILRIPEPCSRNFLTALVTKRFAILTGLSGSGKTQIALRLGDWFGGEAYREIVPVRPDWTGPEPLLGYEDGLATPNEHGQRPYHAPDVLKFMLKAAKDSDRPYLLILDEMNLAHVERYFADILSGLESNEAVLPYIENGYQTKRIPLPTNLFIVGTVNVDETTYMFSPKVLDRANTFEFRVETDDLDENQQRPTKAEPGDEALIRGFLAIAREEATPTNKAFADHFKTLHKLLTKADWEFGHRTFYEANRFATLLAAAGEPDLHEALDAQLMQKILPRLHGNRRRLEPTLCALGRFCIELAYTDDEKQIERYKTLMEQKPTPKLRTSHAKIERMLRNLRANQFASFTE